MRLAFLADIHGNLPALEAVLADLQHYAPDAVYLLGDQINRCPWNNEVLDRLEEKGWPALLGNHEYVIARIRTAKNFPPFTNEQRFPTLWWTQAQLSEHHLQTIRQLKSEQYLEFAGAPSLYLTHGIPGNSFVGMFLSDTDAVVKERLEKIAESFVVVAHTHHAMSRIVERWHLFNPGSVGMPYNGDRRAQYLLLDQEGQKWLPTFRRLDYDYAWLEEGFRTSAMKEAIGAEAELHLRTALTGLPWSSDFNFWLGQQPAPMQQDIPHAIEHYLARHGPGKWAFTELT